jgi:hypothetical protein
MSGVVTMARSLTPAMRRVLIEDGGSKRTVRKLFDMGLAGSIRYHGSFAIVRKWSADALAVREYLMSVPAKLAAAA